MQRILIVAVSALAFGCSSIHTATVIRTDVAAPGDPIAVVQSDAVGLSLFLHLVPLVQADLDTVVNKGLVASAKAMGGTKVEIKEASQTPTDGVYALLNCLFPIPLLLCAKTAHAVGVVIK
jgi:hypothetical protein